MAVEGKVFRATLWASGVIALLDCIYAARGPLSQSGAVGCGFIVSAILFLGGCLGLFFENWIRKIEQATSRWPAWRRNFVVSIPLILFGWWVPAGWIEEHRRALGFVGWLLVLVYALVVVLGSVALTAGVRWWTRRSPSTLAHLALGLGLCMLAGVGFLVDARVLVSLYEDFHLGLFMGASLCVAFALWLLLRMLPRRFEYPKKVDLGVLALGALVLGVLSVGFSWQSPPPGTLAFSKISRLPAGFVEDELNFSGEGKRARLEATDYEVVRCDSCNVLLLTIDALRADHVGAYGYSRNTTPHLDALIEDSLQFLNAYAQATKTFDSLPSIYAGLYPSELDRNYEHPRLEHAKSYLFYVDEKTTFLSQRLKSVGYSTGAFFGFHFEQFGYHRGFDTVAEDRRNVTPHVLRFLEQAKEPFFASVHLDFPHEPYVSHKGHDFGPEPIDRYDSEIAFADAQLGKILNLLKGKNLLENTIFIVSADHGEEFGEHGGQFHSRKLHEELLHVPLVVHHPKLPTQVVDEYVELVDIAPFLVEVLGLNVPAQAFSGQSLLAAAHGQRDSSRRGAYSQNFERRGLKAASIVTPEWRATMGSAVGGFQLFDRESDPKEQLDVASQHPEVKKEYGKVIRARAR